MAISKVQKQELVKQYSESLQAAKSAVVLQQNAIPVSVMVNLRKGLVPVQSKVNVVRKKLFMRALQDAGYQDVGI
jgi:ribosomal protein L10